MEAPEVLRCGDGHYRKVFYGLGPYIADYPEQALVTCVVQGWCPTCVISAVLTFGHLTLSYRCRARRGELEDGNEHGIRAREYTDFLVESYELGELWKQYGIVGDIVVGLTSFK